MQTTSFWAYLEVALRRPSCLGYFSAWATLSCCAMKVTPPPPPALIRALLDLNMYVAAAPMLNLWMPAGLIPEGDDHPQSMARVQ